MYIGITLKIVKREAQEQCHLNLLFVSRKTLWIVFGNLGSVPSLCHVSCNVTRMHAPVLTADMWRHTNIQSQDCSTIHDWGSTADGSEILLL